MDTPDPTLEPVEPPAPPAQPTPSGPSGPDLDLLTDRQRQLYDWLLAYLRQHGGSPSLRACAQALGIRNINGVLCHLQALEKKGFITRSGRQARGIRLQVLAPVQASYHPAGVALDMGERIHLLSREQARRLALELLKAAAR